MASVIYTGNPMFGTAADDFMLGHGTLAGPTSHMVAYGGDDFLFGDISNFHILTADTTNGSTN